MNLSKHTNIVSNCLLQLSYSDLCVCVCIKIRKFYERSHPTHSMFVASLDSSLAASIITTCREHFCPKNDSYDTPIHHSELAHFFRCFDRKRSLSSSKYRVETCQFIRISMTGLIKVSFLLKNFPQCL